MNPLQILAKLGTSLEKVFSEVENQISIDSGISLLTSQTQDAISELKKLDTLLTELSKANSSLTSSNLEEISTAALNAAAKYNKAASDFLESFKAATLAGYENAKGIAELSLAIQSAGNLSAELAEKLITATDEAYNLGGSVENLTKILDGAYAIASCNSISMEELAKGIATAGSQAAELGISAGETAAVLATMMTSTKQSGTETAEALNKMLLCLSQAADAGNELNPTGITKYEEACQALNVSLKTTKNGIKSLRDPMSIIHDLAEEYTKLTPDDKKRTSLLDSVGGGNNVDALDALLSNYDTYENILRDYVQGMDSIASATEQTSGSWEGALNRLANTWTKTVGNIMDPDTIIPVIDALNGLASVLNIITGGLGTMGSIGLGAGIFAGLKNVGVAKLD